jgi:hypothetical protein
VLAAALLAMAALAADADPLRTLRAGHPRLYLTPARLDELRTRLLSDPTARGLYERLESDAAAMLAEPPVRHELSGGRLLQQSRAALRRVSTLAGLYLLDGDARKAERARAEMLAAAELPDWNPAHFLDTAEMTAALGIGYDWLFEQLGPDERALVRGAIVEKGLRAGARAYAERAGWTGRDNNWNPVCNGGLSIGALAVADEEPALAAETLARAQSSVPLYLRSLGPDGGSPEGPMYWNYGTRYAALYLAALESALGHDSGLAQSRGLADTGLYRIHAIGPRGLQFNYSDARDTVEAAPQMLWLARRFERPEYARHELAVAAARPGIFQLVWYVPAVPGGPLALDAAFRGVAAAFFRSGWDERATYVAFKGGDSGASHSQLDLGTFVLDALGRRWAVDLGGDDYDLPGYFDFQRQRWTYYRNATAGQNTLVLDGANQQPRAKAPLIAFDSAPARAFAVADLTAAYADRARRVWRGVTLLDRRDVLVEDELQLARPVEVAWQMHTRAEVELRGDRALLRQEGETLEARILAPRGARFEVRPASAPPPQGQQPDVRVLTVRWPRARGSVRLAVWLSPGGAPAAAPRVEPLSRWVERAGQVWVP